MSEKTIHIACAIDDGYVPHCGIMLESLFVNNANEYFFVHVISDGISLQHQRQLTRIVSKRKSQIRYYTVDNGILDGAPITHPLSLSTYYRILIPTIVDQKVDKILFLDSDIIINGSISALWSVDVRSYSHAAVINPYKTEEENVILGIPRKSEYFNAGVLLINADWWRKNKIKEHAIQYLSAHKNVVKFMDQDVLNALTFDRWKILPPKWNAIPSYVVNPDASALKLEREDMEEVSSAPVIIHFAGSGNSKPWHYGCRHPYKNLYFLHKRNTVWKRTPLISAPKTAMQMVLQKILGKCERIVNQIKAI